MADQTKEQVPPGIDPTVPSVARVYDYFLGGTTNFAADRKLAAEVLQRMPEARDAARANRRFLGRAVEFLAEAGIRQFIDVGAGLPSQNNVHEVAQRIHPDTRVVYIDHDPIVLAHARALLGDGDSTAVIQGDVHEPARILAHPTVREMIDFTRPVALMLVSVLHFVLRENEARGIVSALTRPLVPGSYLTISHATFDAHPGDEVTASLVERWRQSTPLLFRSGAAIADFFDGFDLVDPGVVNLTDWRADESERSRPGGEWMLAGMGRKP